MQNDKSKKERIQAILRLRQAVRFVWESGPGWGIANVVLIVIEGVLPLLLLYIMKLVVDSVTAGIAAPDKTYDGRTNTGYPTSSANLKACSFVVN